MPPAVFPVRQLAQPTSEQTEEIIHVVMDAFRGDPFVSTTLGGREADEELYYRFNRAHVVGALVDGELWVAEDGGKVVGVALWFPPGKQFLGSDEQRALAGMDKIIDELGEGMKKWWYDYFIPRNVEQAASSLGMNRVDALHLLVLAVLPSHHNKGIGRSLMYVRAAQGWSAGKRVCWEAGNEPNVAKYTKWGGRALSRQRYDGDAEGRGFDMWIMDLPKVEGVA